MSLKATFLAAAILASVGCSNGPRGAGTQSVQGTSATATATATASPSVAVPSPAGGTSTLSRGESPYIFGLHDPGGEKLMADKGKKGWILFYSPLNDGISNDTEDFTPWESQGYGILVRVDNSWKPNEGSLPCEKNYAAFSDQIRDYVAKTKGAHKWIIGNETNIFDTNSSTGVVEGTHPVCDGKPEYTTPDRYVKFFKMARDKIRSLKDHENDKVIVSPSSPRMNDFRIHGVDYNREIWEKLGAGQFDGIALHAYTDTHDAALLDSDYKGAPSNGVYRWNFPVLYDQINAVPGFAKNLPVYLTETCPGEPWGNDNRGWISGMYQRVNTWNQNPANQKIHAALIYRWADFDASGIKTKPELHRDFQNAMNFDYRWTASSSPVISPSPSVTQTPQPGATATLTAAVSPTPVPSASPTQSSTEKFPPAEGWWKTSTGKKYYFNGPQNGSLMCRKSIGNSALPSLGVFNPTRDLDSPTVGTCDPDAVPPRHPSSAGEWRDAANQAYFFNGTTSGSQYCRIVPDTPLSNSKGVVNPIVPVDEMGPCQQ